MPVRRKGRVMSRYRWWTVVVLAALCCQLGCACIDQPYQPTACSDGWDPMFGSCDSCGTCAGDCSGHTPISYAGHVLTCGSVCGEIYWGEWTSDPPAPCDPCDNHGNWVGPQPCGPAHWETFLAGFAGGRIGGAECGCSECGGVAVAPTKGGPPIHVLEPPQPKFDLQPPLPPQPSNQTRTSTFLHSARFQR